MSIAKIFQDANMNDTNEFLNILKKIVGVKELDSMILAQSFTISVLNMDTQKIDY